MKRFVWIIMAASMLHACKEHTGYTIQGELSGAEGMQLVLKKITIDSDEPVMFDSCIVKKGKFQMKGTVDYPEYCKLYAGDNGPLWLLVENTVIDIALDLKNMQESKVNGSIETNLLAEYYAQMVAFGDSATKVNDDYLLNRQSGETNVDKESAYIARMMMIRQQRIDYVKQFVAEHPNSITTALIVIDNESVFLPEELEEFVNGFDEPNSNSPWVQSFREKTETALRLAIGQPFTDIKMPAPDGNEIALSDYAGKDKYVLIDFWASWCRPCRIANPQIVKIYNKYKDKGFEIVGVSLDRDKAEWTKAIKDDALEWIQMSDLNYWKSEAVRLYAINTIPYTVLLDKEGNILEKGLKPDELEKKLKELLETKK